MSSLHLTLVLWLLCSFTSQASEAIADAFLGLWQASGIIKDNKIYVVDNGHYELFTKDGRILKYRERPNSDSVPFATQPLSIDTDGTMTVKDPQGNPVLLGKATIKAKDLLYIKSAGGEIGTLSIRAPKQHATEQGAAANP